MTVHSFGPIRHEERVAWATRTSDWSSSTVQITHRVGVLQIGEAWPTSSTARGGWTLTRAAISRAASSIRTPPAINTPVTPLKLNIAPPPTAIVFAVLAGRIRLIDKPPGRCRGNGSRLSRCRYAVHASPFLLLESGAPPHASTRLKGDVRNVFRRRHLQ